MKPAKSGPPPVSTPYAELCILFNPAPILAVGSLCKISTLLATSFTSLFFRTLPLRALSGGGDIGEFEEITHLTFQLRPFADDRTAVSWRSLEPDSNAIVRQVIPVFLDFA